MINKKILLILFSFVYILFPGSPSMAEVLVSENFDDWDDYLYGDSSHTVPLPWTPRHATGVWSHTADGETRSPLEISAPGRGGSGKSLKIWRKEGVWGGNPYFPSFDIDRRNVPQLAGQVSVLYMSYYMRFPTTFIHKGAQKLWRFNATGGQFGFNFSYGGSGSVFTQPYFATRTLHLANSPLWQTGGWHHHQFYMNLDTGDFTYWIDGEVRYHEAAQPELLAMSHFGDASGLFIQHFPFGNSFTTPEQHSDWQFIEFDDVVIATTKAPTDPIEGGPINGVCGSNNNSSFASLTSASLGNCSSGSVAGFTGTGPWSWTCAGSNGGTPSATCNALLGASAIQPPPLLQLY